MKWGDLLGTIFDTFRIGYDKLTLDASGLSAPRTLIIPDRSGTVSIVVMQTTAPSDPFDGLIWWNSETGNAYIYYEDGDSNQWVSLSRGVKGDQGEAGAQGAPGDSGILGIWQGDWSAGTYNQDDVVRNDNSLWIATATTTTEEPTGTPTDWDLLLGPNAAFLDQIQSFTAPQRGNITTANDGVFNLSLSQHFSCTPTGIVTLQFDNLVAGQSGVIVLDNAGAHTISIETASIETTADAATDLSVAGKYAVSYHVPSGAAKVIMTYSGALA